VDIELAAAHLHGMLDELRVERAAAPKEPRRASVR
jgi:hypothetical protein